MQETKSELLKARVTPGQLERIQRAARVEAMTVSEWLRRLALLRVAELGARIGDSDGR
jgi:uncharacterized protein (DUF1778 family)